MTRRPRGFLTVRLGGRPAKGLVPLFWSGQQGLALIECLISLVIFSVGVLGLMGLEARAINFSSDAQDRNRAALFANDVGSTMWLAGTVTIPAATMTAWQTAIADPTKTGLANGTLGIAAVANTTNAADITITWKPPSRTQLDTSSSLTTRVILP